MKKSRYKEEQIIAVLKEVDAGAKVQDVIRRLGVTEQTYYRWKAKFGGMEVSDAKKLKALEDENRRLKQMVAEQALDIQALKAVVAKNGEAVGVPPSRRLPAERVRIQRATRVQRARLSAFELPLRCQAGDGARSARRDSSSRCGSAKVRVPPHPRAPNDAAAGG
jgi:putative transposase